MIRSQGDTLVLEGPITVANVQAVLADGERLFTQLEVRVDLSGVTEVDSSALSLLLEWARWAAKNRRRIAFLNLPANLSSLAALYGVGHLIPSA